MAWDATVENRPFGGILLFLAKFGDDGSCDAVTDIEFKRIASGERVDDKDAVILNDTQMLQALLDAAWNYGLRPTNGLSDKQELNAVRAHLNDMTEITRHVLKMNK